MPKLLGILIVCLACSLGVYSQKCMKPGKCAGATSWKTCPRKGSNADLKLNSAKNRPDKPNDNDVTDKVISEIAVVKPPLSPGQKKWKSNADRTPLTDLIEGEALRVTLFLKHITTYPQGAEACNCNLNGERNNDFHIVLVAKRSDAEKKSLTAEISPRIRPAGWTSKKLKKLAKTHPLVRVTGWAMLDTQHVGSKVPVRATHWEIHPVTKFEVCMKTDQECMAGDGWKNLEDVQ